LPTRWSALFKAVASQLGPQEAGRAALDIIAAMPTDGGLPQDWNNYSEALKALAERLESREAASAGQALLALPSLQRGSHPLELESLADILEALGSKMDSAEAARTSLGLIGLLDRGGFRGRLGLVLKALAGRLEPEAATRISRALMPQMEKTHDWEVPIFAEALRVLAERIDPIEVNRAATALTARLEKGDPSYGRNPLPIVLALEALAGRLTPQEADRVERALASEFEEGKQPLRIANPSQNRAETGRVLGAVGRRGGTACAGRTALLLLTHLDKATTVAAAAFTTGLEDAVRGLNEQGLVEVLKSPLCVGRARSVILAELGRRAGRAFPTVWEFVLWAGTNQRSLDLHGPLLPDF
jgi:hypothetical protein